MKARTILFFTLAALVVYSFAACKTDTDADNDPKKIALEYRFDDGKWFNWDGVNNNENGKVSIDINTITFTASEITDIIGVYTTGGGIYNSDPNQTWTYLYNNANKKIGIIVIFDDGSTEIDFGASWINFNYVGELFDVSKAIVTADMQDTFEGYWYKD